MNDKPQPPKEIWLEEDCALAFEVNDTAEAWKELEHNYNVHYVHIDEHQRIVGECMRHINELNQECAELRTKLRQWEGAEE